MEELELKSTIMSCQMDELSDAERHLVELAIEATESKLCPIFTFQCRCSRTACQWSGDHWLQSGKCSLSIGALR